MIVIVRSSTVTPVGDGAVVSCALAAGVVTSTTFEAGPGPAALIAKTRYRSLVPGAIS